MRSQFHGLKIFQIGLFILILAGCQKMKPEKISIPEYPDLGEVYNSQYRELDSRSLEKEVSLDSKTESNTFSMDTAKWKEELSFFAEMNPNQPEYVGVFEVTETGNMKTLKLRENEIGILKSVSLEKSDENYSKIIATIHEDKDVYAHHREIEVSFENGLINSFSIEGYQKIMFKDTVRFRIRGEVSL